ncbi:hypothetical protein GCM10009624_25120 [Gordonia sinesedis]
MDTHDSDSAAEPSAPSSAPPAIAGRAAGAPEQRSPWRRLPARAPQILIAVGVVLIVVGLVGVKLWVTRDASPNGANLQAILLQGNDFPPGYRVTAGESISVERLPIDSVSPTECQSVIDDQGRRTPGQQRDGLTASPGGNTIPTYTQAVMVGGESIDETAGVVRACPSYNYTASGTRFAVTQSIAPAPPACPTDALYVRTQLDIRSETAAGNGRPSSASVQTMSAFVERGSLRSIFAQIGRGEPDGEFCRLVTLAKGKLDQAD